MEIFVDEDRRVVEYRQTRRERENQLLREALRPVFRDWKRRGYRPLVVPARGFVLWQ